MYLSIVIPAFNEEQHLPTTITRIRKAMEAQHLDDRDWEIIVCDNNSSDHTSEIAIDMGVKVVYEAINQISRARNTGATAAKGKWILFIDADTYPFSGTMSDVLRVMSENNLVGGGSTAIVHDNLVFRYFPLKLFAWLYRNLNVCGGAFLFCRKSAFNSIGGFSTELYAFEEVDFIKRLKKYGKKHNLTFKVLGRHPISTSGRKGSLNPLSGLRFFKAASIGFTIYVLHFILPARHIRTISKKFLSYWYSGTRE